MSHSQAAGGSIESRASWVAAGAVFAVLSVTYGAPLAMVVGMFARKDAAGFFAPFAALKPVVITTPFDSPIAADAEDLAIAARAAGLDARSERSIAAALDSALRFEGPAPHLLICGGLHFAGEVLAMSAETWPR